MLLYYRNYSLSYESFSEHNSKKDLDSLLVPFDYMVEMQIHYENENQRKIAKRKINDSTHKRNNISRR